eukprot:TRINITY_DN3730_c0_g2_i7.p1 TRINITY_DN3730_c0_g2~~TRINITY_DN3730_c0_g2_i7.p1  ORF type:complete len:134 (+),score=26.66 TRINITY_DN3730_c0_g2_i7:81-482(+)
MHRILLVGHSIVLGLVGFFMFMKPSFVVSLLTVTRIPREGLSLVAGWGTALVSLALICWGMSKVHNFYALQAVTRGLCVMWIGLVMGTKQMLTGKKEQHWNNAIYLIIAIEIVMILLTLYKGFLVRKKEEEEK